MRLLCIGSLAAFGILLTGAMALDSAGQADAAAFQHQTAEGERFGLSQPFGLRSYLGRWPGALTPQRATLIWSLTSRASTRWNSVSSDIG